MPNVRCDLELETSAPRFSVPASSTDNTIHFDAPDGYFILSWGFSALHPDLRISNAVINQSDGPGDPMTFIGKVDNAGTEDHTMIWTFVLVKA